MNKLQAIVLEAPATPTEGGGGTTILLMYVLMIAGMYFLMIAPSRKQQKEIKKFQDELSIGASVVTTGGIFGKVVQVSDTKVTLQLAEGVRVAFLRTAVLGAAEESDKAPGQASLN